MPADSRSLAAGTWRTSVSSLTRSPSTRIVLSSSTSTSQAPCGASTRPAPSTATWQGSSRLESNSSEIRSPPRPGSPAVRASCQGAADPPCSGACASPGSTTNGTWPRACSFVPPPAREVRVPTSTVRGAPSSTAPPCLMRTATRWPGSSPSRVSRRTRS
ncbi:hypothetical protein [Nonomuraea salmonea]|uniref:hypothetical protein n=1 Tax=Nonomuraea salmonea TaxID=46181 RepID=UPI0031E731E1